MNYFTYPQALWAMMLLPVLGQLALWSRFRKRRGLARLGNLLTLQRSATTRTSLKWARRLCLVLGLILLVLGIAGPRWGHDVAIETVTGRDVVLVLDLSRSMFAEPKSRQERAIAALLHLCETVEKRGGHRLALVVFAARAEIVCPLTHDYDHFRFVLDQLKEKNLFPKIYPKTGSDVSGTRIGEALTLAVQLHGGGAPGAQDILLLSDGDDPGNDEEWRQGIGAALQAQIPVDVAGIGDPVNSWPIPIGNDYMYHDDKLVKTKLEEGPLREIAAQTRGTYIPLRTKRLPLGNLYHEILANRDKQRDNDEGAFLVHRQRYPWFLGPALGLLVLTVLIGDGRKVRRRAQRAELSASGGRKSPDSGPHAPIQDRMPDQGTHVPRSPRPESRPRQPMMEKIL